MERNLANVVPLHLDMLDVSSNLAYQRCSHSGRSFQRSVSDLVSDRRIDLVADTGEHRHWRVGDCAGEHFIVEHGEVTARTTATDEHDDIDIGASVKRAQPSRETVRG